MHLKVYPALRRILFIILIFKTAYSYSQIPNGDFEVWQPNRPDLWQVISNGLVPASIVPDSDAHSGFLSVRGSVVLNNNQLPSEPYLGYEGPSAAGFAVNTRWGFAGLWLKLSLRPGDVFFGNAIMFDGQKEPMGYGSIHYAQDVGPWTLFYFPINYTTSQIPAWCTMYFTILDSSLSSSGQHGSYYLLDDLTLTGLAETIGENEDESLLVYPVPSEGDVKVRNLSHEGNYFYTLTDVRGREVRKIYTSQKEFTLGNLNAGIYFLTMRSEGKLLRRKLLVD